MQVLVDENLGPDARAHVEQVVRAVLGLHPRADTLLVSVVRLGPGRWNVFVHDTDPGQFALLPGGASTFDAQVALITARLAGL